MGTNESERAAGIKPYYHETRYYETDKMGIIHHSNYIRWMEEARLDFLEKIGISYIHMEDLGIASPVVEVDCCYRDMVRFGDTVEIVVSVDKYSGVKLELSYVMRNLTNGKVCATCKSRHGFIDSEGKLISLKKAQPDIDELMMDYIKSCK